MADIPRFIYGTAWKENETQRLTELAIQQGFRGIDTANQRRHYHEAGVGAAIQACLQKGLVTRDDLFLQTKYTFQRGQDHRLPYDAKAAVGVQVEQSFASSLEHLGVDGIDSYVLHGPSLRTGLIADDWAAWRAMESLHGRKLVRMLGVSNVSREQLEALCREASVQPTFVQNRCYANQGWDRSVREFCADRKILYQGFSLLTANRDVMAKIGIARIAQRLGRTVSQIIFRFALEIGMIPLTGTTSAAHMRADLEALDFALEPAEVAVITGIASAKI